MTDFRNVCPLVMGKLTRMSDYGKKYVYREYYGQVDCIEWIGSYNISGLIFPN